MSGQERRQQRRERVDFPVRIRMDTGEEFDGVVTGITNFGIFIQLTTYLADGLIRYEDLMDDWWDVDERGGYVRGQRTGTRIGIGDVLRVTETTHVEAECTGGTSLSCGIKRAAPINRLLGEALQAFISVLDQHTLAELISARPKEAVPLEVAPKKKRRASAAANC